MRHILKSAVALLALSTAAILPGPPAQAADPLRVGATFIASGTDPAKGSNGWALVSHGVGENLFSVDPDGKLVPELAAQAERTGDLTWTVTLKPGRSFSDGSPVTAQSVAGGLANTMANNKAALATGGTLSFAADGELTLKVTTEKPVPYIQALFAEWPLIVYKLNADGTTVFTGPYEIAGFKADSAIELAANKHFDKADTRSPVTFRKFGDGQTLSLALEAGELDLAFGLPSEVIPRLQANPDLAIKSFPVGYQYLAFLNTKHAQLSDIKVRQAVDLALDRTQLAAAINGGLPATGAYAPYFPFAGKEPRPTDAAKANLLLDQAGWTRNASGQREKDGQPLKLIVAAYPQRPDLVTMLPVVKAELAAAGIEVETKVVENATEVATAGDFDVFLWAQHTAPSGDPAFFLNSMLRGGASLNHAKYASPEFDAILDRFAGESDPAKRIAIAHDAQVKLFEDVPVSFLLSPVWHVGTSKRLEGYQPWGSDYHVLRADIGEHK